MRKFLSLAMMAMPLVVNAGGMGDLERACEPTAPAPVVQSKMKAWEVGVELFGVQSRNNVLFQDAAGSTTVRSKNDGIMWGSTGSYTYRENMVFAKLDARFDSGKLDRKFRTTPEVRSNDQRAMTFEGRGLVGWDDAFNSADVFRFTPYIGLGWRTFSIKAKNKTVNATTFLAPNEFSSLVYIPVGMEAKVPFQDGWMMGMTAEVDPIFNAVHKMTYRNFAGTPRIKFTPKNGFGLRGSVSVEKDFDTMAIGLEPFVRFWDIKSSKGRFMNVNGVTTVAKLGKERTTEWGAKLFFKF
jgi:hypothetical protein